LKIVLFNTYSIFGGAARACYRLHQGFRTEGHESALLVRHHHGAALDGVYIYSGTRPKESDAHNNVLSRIRSEALVAPESTYFSPPSPRTHVGRSKSLVQADAVNIHWVADYLSSQDLRDLFNCGKPVVWTLHDARAFTGGCHYPGDCLGFQQDCSDCPQLRMPFRSLASTGLSVGRSVFESSQMPAFVAPSAWLARLAATSPLLTGARIEVIPNSLDTTIYRPNAGNYSKGEMNLPDEAFVVLFGSHSVKDKRKGVDLVFEAIRRCIRQQDVGEMLQEGKLVFACFGESQELEGAQSLPIRMLGSFSGDENAARVYQCADVFICASREDNLPNTVMEAMACGVAVLGTKVGGIPEMVDDGRTGRLVPGGDEAALADALLDLIRNKDKTRSMGAAARAKCEEFYTPSRQVEAYVRLFEDIRGQSPRIRGSSLRQPINPKQAEAKCKIELRRFSKQGTIGGEVSPEGRARLATIATTWIRQVYKIVTERLVEGATRKLVGCSQPVEIQRAGIDVQDASAIVTALEVNSAHGTGILLKRIFKNDVDFVHVRCTDFYKDGSEGALRLCVPYGANAEKILPSILGQSSIERILVVPWHQQDVLNALALKKLHGAKMCVWVMDHNIGEAPGNVSEANMRKLAAEADLLLAISTELAEYYTALFRRPFYFAPPVVDEALAQTEALPAPRQMNGCSKRGALVGNVWSARWLEFLMRAFQTTHLNIDAFGFNAPPQIDASSLEKLVTIRGHVPEAELISSLRKSSYAIVPGGTLDEHDDLLTVSQFSLPSRVVYLAAVGNTPIVYLGSEKTAAAQFIKRYDLGVVCPYSSGELQGAVDWICHPEQQKRFRRAAARAASWLCMDNMAGWIWSSTAKGQPIDNRWSPDVKNPSQPAAAG
jgi:glycosyltransferase involved in cell wall biosynthesis